MFDNKLLKDIALISLSNDIFEELMAWQITRNYLNKKIMKSPYELLQTDETTDVTNDTSQYTTIDMPW